MIFVKNWIISLFITDSCLQNFVGCQIFVTKFFTCRWPAASFSWIKARRKESFCRFTTNWWQQTKELHAIRWTHPNYSYVFYSFAVGFHRPSYYKQLFGYRSYSSSCCWLQNQTQCILPYIFFEHIECGRKSFLDNSVWPASARFFEIWFLSDTISNWWLAVYCCSRPRRS